MRLILAVGLVYGCGGKSADEGDIVDTAACAGVPVVNWANFGEGWLLQECQGCHGSAVTTRHEAPVDMTFDTVDQAWAHKARILARAGAEPPTMPPSGATQADDRTRLRWWLECGTVGQ